MHSADDDGTFLIEGQAGTKINGAGDATLDHVGCLILVCIGAGEQFRRDVVEVNSASCRVGRKGVAAIELGAHLRQAANENVRRFARRVRDVVVRLQAIDGNSRQSLQRVGR